MLRHVGSVSILLCLLPAAGLADIVVPGANGADGAFSPTAANTVVDLSLAATVSFADFEAGINPPDFVPGNGVYIPEQWAVVFRYASVNIPSNVTVTFTNHPSRAPVVWLVSESATIAGSVRLNGAQRAALGPWPLLEPGPGGFRGGAPHLGGLNRGSAGFGPGGNNLTFLNTYAGAGHSEPGGGNAAIRGGAYGNAQLLPLIGGSGVNDYSYPSGSGSVGRPGASGGGAILVAASGAITLTGSIQANGAGDGGAAASSGGAIRLVADSLQGAGSLQANGGLGAGASGNGSPGRIRIEANGGNFTGSTSPAASPALAGPLAVVWPPASAPRLRILSVGGVAAPADPRASFAFPLPDITTTELAPLIVLEGENVPLDWQVTVRIIPLSGNNITLTITAPDPGSTPALSTWSVVAPLLPNGVSAIQARAFQP